MLATDGEWLDALSFGCAALAEPIWLFTLVAIVMLVRFLNLCSYPERPQVTYLGKSGRSKVDDPTIADVLKRCTMLNEIYKPSIFWGRSGHLQTIAYGLFGQTSLKRTYDRRHVIRQADGASMIFDVFEPVKPHPSEKDYTLTLCPGIANTSESNYIRTCVHYAQEHGFRCAVLNHLGALKRIPLTSNRIFSYGGFSESESMIDRLIELYPSTRFICVGFSMGANITTRLLAHMPRSKLQKVVLGLSVGQGYSADKSAALYLQWENGRRAYNYAITENMKRLLRRNYEMAVAPHVRSGLIDEQRLWSATSMATLDDSYSRRVFGYDSVEHMYTDMSSASLIPTLKVPMVFVNALDDPLIPQCLWKPVQNMARKSDKLGFILTKHGGHLGFLESNGVIPNAITWLDRFIVEVADAAIVTFESDFGN